MAVILLEALLVLALAGFIVWWTMFSGRRPEQSNDEDGDRPDGQ